VRWWPELRALVDDVVMIATPNHGSVFADVSCVTDCLPALWQTRTGSRLLAALNQGDETPGAVDYTSVFSTTDPVIQPATTAPVAGAANVAVQDVCPGRVVEHAQAVFDAAVHAVVLDALRHRGPAVAARVRRASCAQLVMRHVSVLDAVSGEAEIYAKSIAEQAVFPKVSAEPPLAAYVGRGRGGPGR
jgi:triacylglycerol lipase